MICPNKNSKEWKDLRDAVKTQLESEGVKPTEEEIDDVAFLAFDRYGDIPPADKAFDYLNENVSKVDKDFDRYANFGKGRFITRQGEMSFDDFMQDFKDRFQSEITDESIAKGIYEEAKKRYESQKLAEGKLTNFAAEAQIEKGKKGVYSDIIPRIKNFFSRNFNKLQKEDQASKDAAAKYFSSATQASLLIKQAANYISRTFGAEAWTDLRKALVQSRLYGITERWKGLASEVRKMSDEDLIDKIANGELVDLLKNIQQRTGMDELANTALVLAKSGNFAGLKEHIADAFEHASEMVAGVDFSGGRTFKEIIADDKVMGALKTYKDLIEKELNDNHASNDGVFSNALGELNTYYPLIPLDEKGNMMADLKQRNKINKPKNAANNFATGLSYAYDLSVNKLSQQLQKSFKSNNKSAFISQMQQAGLLRIKAPGEAKPDVVTINGVDYEAVSIDFGEPMIINGQRIPAGQMIMPKWLAVELKPMLDERVITENGFGKVMSGITNYSLGGPKEFLIHSNNLLGAIVNGTPFAGTSLISKTIGNLPVTKILTGILNAAFEDVNSENAVRHMQDMAKIGLLAEKTGSVTMSKRIAELTGAKRVSWIHAPSVWLYGPKGIDIKSRVLMDRICLEINPNATPEQRRLFSAQLGVYVKGLEGQLERSLKRNGLAPFYTASSTFLRNGVKAWLGLVPMPTDGLSFGKAATYRVAQQLSSGAIGMVATWAILYKANTGKYPWDDKKSTLLQIPLTEEQKKTISQNPKLKGLFYKNGKWQDFSVGLLNPILYRGAKATGLQAMYNTEMAGGTAGQMVENVQRDQINSFLTPMVSSPSIHLASTAAFGISPYLTSMRDYATGNPMPQFQRTVKTMENSIQQIGANTAQGLQEINPLVGSAFEAAGLDFKPNYAKEDEDSQRWLGMLNDMAFPNMFKPHIDNEKRAKQLATERKKTENQYKRESGERKPSGSSKGGFGGGLGRGGLGGTGF